ncbi:hypothetical protein ACFPFV_04485 [Salinicoccus siamensis]
MAKLNLKFAFLDQSDNKRVFYKFKKDMLPFMYWHALLKGRI